jgi:two-component system heavy metal sensor histidine kinase CusS
MNPGQKKPYSIGLRLSWTFAGQTLLGLGATSLGIYLVMLINLSHRADAELARKAALVQHLVNEARQSGDLPTMRHKLDEFFVAHDDLEVTLMDASGYPTYTGDAASGRTQQPSAQHYI